MFLFRDKEYYPLEIVQIIKDDKVLYDRNKRGKSYFYLDINDENLGDELNG